MIGQKTEVPLGFFGKTEAVELHNKTRPVTHSRYRSRPAYHAPRRMFGVVMVEATTTLIAWATIWYLLIGVATIVVWGAVGHVVYLQFLREEVFLDTLLIIRYLLCLAIGVFVISKTWVEYNYQRFGRNERRKKRPDATLEQFAEAVDLSSSEVASLRKQQVISVSLMTRFPGRRHNLGFYYNQAPV